MLKKINKQNSKNRTSEQYSVDLNKVSNMHGNIQQDTIRINVIDKGTELLKVISLTGSSQNTSKLRLSGCFILNIANMSDKTVMIELKQILEDNGLISADRNVFKLNKEVALSVNSIENSVDKKDIKAELLKLKYQDELLEEERLNASNKGKPKKAKNKKDTPPNEMHMLFKSLFSNSTSDVSSSSTFIIEQDSKETDHNLYPIRSSVSKDTIQLYSKFVSLLNLRGAMLVDDSYLAKLYNFDYSVVDIGSSEIVEYICKSGNLIEVKNIAAGMSSLFNSMSVTGDDRYLFDSTMQNDLSSDIKIKLEEAIRIPSSGISKGMLYIVGGGNNHLLLKESKDRQMYTLKDKVAGVVSNKIIPDPLMNYIGTSILLGHMVANNTQIFNYLGNSKEIELPILDKLTENKSKIVAYNILIGCLFILTLSTLLFFRGIYNTGLYQSSLTEAVQQLPYIFSSVQEVSRNSPNDFTPQLTELDALYQEASDKLMAIDELSDLKYPGVTFNDILSKTNSVSTANLVSIKRVGEKTVTYEFRGNIGDVPVVEEILLSHYSNVKYNVKRIDDLKSFSVMNFEFTCDEY